mgnify:CR=1 FL=1
MFSAVEIDYPKPGKKDAGIIPRGAVPIRFLSARKYGYTQVQGSADALYQRPYRRALRAAIGEFFSERADDPH